MEMLMVLKTVMVASEARPHVAEQQAAGTLSPWVCAHDVADAGEQRSKMHLVHNFHLGGPEKAHRNK